MTDARETILQELSRLESRQGTQAGPTDEGLSPEVQRRMAEGRARVRQATENLKVEQAANEALGEPMPGDVAGEAVEAELDDQQRRSSEAGRLRRSSAGWPKGGPEQKRSLQTSPLRRTRPRRSETTCRATWQAKPWAGPLMKRTAPPRPA